MFAKNDILRIVLILINLLLVTHVFFMSSALAETRAALNMSLADLSLWRRLVGQSSNLAFFGSFFIFQIVCYAVFFRKFLVVWHRLNVINLILAITGAAISIHGGLGWSLIFPGVA